MSLYGRVDSAANQTAVGLTEVMAQGLQQKLLYSLTRPRQVWQRTKSVVSPPLDGGHIAPTLMQQVTLATRQST